MPEDALPTSIKVLGIFALASLIGAATVPDVSFDASVWRKAFARPDHAPAPPDNATTPDKVALGAQLFEDKRLSGAGDLACASCHQPDLSFSDGVPRHSGLDGEPLSRRTPPLWNMAWGLSLFWDGRVTSLESQASSPIENKREMGGDLAKAVRAFGADPEMRKAFASAFPEDPQVSQANIAKAIAAFERTLVSPESKFDRWVKGDDKALDQDEMAGFKLFVGRSACVNCHRGWRFTDEAFHDIGLPGSDRGRGAVLNLPAADRAFKTPSLRERVWSAPYMHDGSLATFDEVIDHYADRVVERPTLSADLPRRVALSATERAQLAAFLNTLSADDPPRPATLPSRAMTAGALVHSVPATTVGQKDRRFSPDAVRLRVGQALTIVNDDTRTHNVRVEGPGLDFGSDGQNPGDTVTIGFPQAGRFEAICGIHPEMRLSIDVTAANIR